MKMLLKITNFDYILSIKDKYFIQIKHINKFSSKCKLLKMNELI